MNTMAGPATMSGELWSLSRRIKAPQVLVIDDFIPGTRSAARLPRAAELLRALAAAGCQITVLPTRDERIENTQGHAVLRLRAGDDLGRVMSTRNAAFTLIVVSRPRNLALVAALAARSRTSIGDALVVYDAERPPTADELAQARHADVVLALEAATAAAYRDAGHADARVLGHAIAPQAPPPFGKRSGFLAVGPTYGDSANLAGAVAWFAGHVLPILRARLGRRATLTVLGAELASAAPLPRTVVPLAAGTDPGATFDRARVLVAPREAGDVLPINAFAAAAHGLPAVLTPAQARRIGWNHGREVLVADTAEEFAAACAALYTDQLLWEGLRAGARSWVDAACGRGRFDAMIREVVMQAVTRRR